MINIFLALYCYFLYVRSTLYNSFLLKHIYLVVRSLSHSKELAENFQSYYNCRRFGVLLTPGVKMRRKSHINFGVCFSSFFLAQSGILVFISSDVKITFLSSFHPKGCK